jgi:hypothetical protein
LLQIQIPVRRDFWVPGEQQRNSHEEETGETWNLDHVGTSFNKKTVLCPKILLIIVSVGSTDLVGQKPKSRNFAVDLVSILLGFM